MTTIRTARSAEGKFTQLANAMLRDNRLSLATRGLISYMLSLPPDTCFTVDSLAKQVPNGRDAVRKMLAEAEQAGYFARHRHQDKAGHWHWEQVISDAPVENPETTAEPSYGNPANGLTSGNSTSPQVAPSAGNPSYGELDDKDFKDGKSSKHETRQSSARAKTDPPKPQQQTMTMVVISEIQNLTGTTVEAEHADLVAFQILGRASQQPANPTAFVRASIRREPDPSVFLPTYTPTPTPPQFRNGEFVRPKVNYTDEEYRAGWGHKPYQNPEDDSVYEVQLKDVIGDSTAGQRAMQAIQAGQRVQEAMDRGWLGVLNREESAYARDIAAPGMRTPRRRGGQMDDLSNENYGPGGTIL